MPEPLRSFKSLGLPPADGAAWVGSSYGLVRRCATEARRFGCAGVGPAG